VQQKAPVFGTKQQIKQSGLTPKRKLNPSRMAELIRLFLPRIGVCLPHRQLPLRQVAGHGDHDLRECSISRIILQCSPNRIVQTSPLSAFKFVGVKLGLKANNRAALSVHKRTFQASIPTGALPAAWQSTVHVCTYEQQPAQLLEGAAPIPTVRMDCCQVDFASHVSLLHRPAELGEVAPRETEYDFANQPLMNDDPNN
jgi:hypothetical protein